MTILNTNYSQTNDHFISNYSRICQDIVTRLTKMLDEHNIYVKSFHIARDGLRNDSVQDLKLRLMSNRSIDGRIYNIPHVSKVAALIPSDIDTGSTRYIILETQKGNLQQLDELHTSYLGYQYPLRFPYGKDGYI